MLGLSAATHTELDPNGDPGGEAIPLAFDAAIAEASRFIGATAPNPPVGCAILDAHGTILAVAAHQRAGQPHAEALALRQCREAGRLDRAATAVVTLEPCNHVGRTGPCTEAILASPIRSVWIGAADPNPNVRGGGAARLRDAGLAVHPASPPGRAALDCAALIAPFAKRSGEGRPWITIKQAIDASGSMIPPVGAKTFTSPASLMLAHRLRRATDAVITGMGTVLADRPHFTVRHVADHPDRRRILAVPDPRGELPAFYRSEAEARGFTLCTAPDLPTLLTLLGQQGVLWAMIEAGPRLLATLEQEGGIWDDWLTICQKPGRRQPGDDDQITVRSRAAVSPLRLIEGIPDSAKGAACSPVS